MEILIEILKFVVPAGYAYTAYLYGRLFFSEDENRFQPMARVALGVTLILHTLFLSVIAVHFGRSPMGTTGEGLLFVAWILAGIHFLSERLADSSRLGMFTLLPTTLSALLAAFLLRHDLALPEEFRTSFFVFHIVASLSSYACFSMAAILASLYLILHRKLKIKRFDLTFRKLPPLDKLDKLSATWSMLGSITMVLSAIIGWWWVRHASLDGMGLTDLSIYLVLLVFLGAGISRRLFAFRGRRHAKVVLVGFAVLLIINLFGTHGFKS